MRNGVVALLVLAYGLVPVAPALALPVCTTTELTSEPSRLPMEQSDPVVSGAYVYLAYVTREALYFLSSSDGGVHFTSQRLDTGKVLSSNRPRIAVAGNRVYIAWISKDAKDGQLLFRRSIDNGKTFSAALSLGPAYTDDSPQIAAAGLGVTVAFVDATRQMTLSSSADGGLTWPNRQVFALSGHAREETVGRLGNNIVAAWSLLGGTSNLAYVASSTDGGATYSEAPLSPVTHGARERQVAVSTTTGTWYIVATDEADTPPKTIGGYTVLFTSSDRGATWSEQKFSPATTNQWILVEGSAIYLAWMQHFPDGLHIEMSYSLDSGLDWTALGDISGPIGVATPTPDEAYRPALSLKGPTLNVLYSAQGKVTMRITDAITKGLSPPITLGEGTNAVIDGWNVLWLGPGVGQHQPVFFAHCS
jgi:hypothetical protein